MSETVVRQESSVSALSLLGIFLRIGVTAFGGSTSAWMHREIVERRKLLSDKDFLTTRVSYKLNLRGPSVDVQTNIPIFVDLGRPVS